jgi:hypothetical protein
MRHLDDDLEAFAEMAEDQVGLARKIVAANAIDATDAANLMMALGIHPCQEVKDAPLLVGVTHYLSRITHRPAPPGSAGRKRASSE